MGLLGNLQIYLFFITWPNTNIEYIHSQKIKFLYSVVIVGADNTDAVNNPEWKIPSKCQEWVCNQGTFICSFPHNPPSKENFLNI